MFGAWRRSLAGIQEDEWFAEQFELALEDLDPHATTGLGPLSLWGPDVATALQRDPLTGSYNPARVRFLKGIVKERLQDPEYPDPILVFVKPEPHKVA